MPKVSLGHCPLVHNTPCLKTWHYEYQYSHNSMVSRSTEAPEIACTRLGEICSCSCLTFLTGPAWVLFSKIYKPFPGPLYSILEKMLPYRKELKWENQLIMTIFWATAYWPLYRVINWVEYLPALAYLLCLALPGSCFMLYSKIYVPGGGGVISTSWTMRATTNSAMSMKVDMLHRMRWLLFFLRVEN